MSDEINSEILITSDIQGIHGVSLVVETLIEIAAIVEGYGQINDGQINNEIEILAEAQSLFGYDGSIDAIFEVVGTSIGNNVCFGEIFSQIAPVSSIRSQFLTKPSAQD